MSQSNGYRKRLVAGRGFDTEREYVHQDYPKLTYDVNGNRVRVESEEEEKALIAEIVEKEEAEKAKNKKPAKGGDTENLE